jgi:hypothetical protein
MHRAKIRLVQVENTDQLHWRIDGLLIRSVGLAV